MQWSISRRPTRLSDLYGLDGIKKYFYERAKKEDWPKATLLRGQFGNGKTTTAKIVAAMMACKSPHANGDPCGECKPCLAIQEERWDADVKLIDGGQSGKSDLIQEVDEFIQTPPFYGARRKVLIIEEVQELSTAARNSLLKTLEHPREWIHFILLSMEQGAASGFASRCVPFNFKKLPIKDIMLFLKKTMEEEGLWTDKSIPDEFRFKGLATIAQVSAGSLRQALQLLEQCTTGGFYTAEQIEENLGILDETTIAQMLLRLLDGDTEVWKSISEVDTMEFFQLGMKILSDAEVYRVSGFQPNDNDFLNAQNRKMAAHPAFPILVDLFLYLGPLAKPFLRKTEMMGHLARAFERIKSSPTITRYIENGGSSNAQREYGQGNHATTASPLAPTPAAVAPTRSIPLRGAPKP
jgi:DNA polymerase III subunit gamma/tau